MKPFLVWSEEHGAWWRPGRWGYTRSIREAGRYSLDEATAIAANANRYVRDGFNEMVVPDPMHWPNTGDDLAELERQMRRRVKDD